MTLASIIQTMTDERCTFNDKLYLRWWPLWRICSVRSVNGKYVITNRPY